VDLAKEAKISLIQPSLASGSTDPASASVDMSGYGSATFIGVTGAADVGAQASLQVQDSDDDSSFADIAGAVITSGFNPDDKLLVIEVKNPAKRYLRTVLTRSGTTNLAWAATLAILHRGRVTPAVVDATHSVAPVSV